ncbi:hypothetical protein HKBW3S06_00811, partial [Candidatus Hakubella thermalkaliphila]
PMHRGAPRRMKIGLFSREDEVSLIKEIVVRTRSRTEFVDITEEVRRAVKESGVDEGVCHLYVPHTTAAITINEGADPSVVKDIVNELNKTIPFDDNYFHREGNAAAHIKSSLIGCSSSILISDGNLVLGTWQSVYFCEFDGPRSRKVYVRVSG